jgi:type II secretory pathway component PulF
MKFQYQGFDASGKPVAGLTDAGDANDAVEVLRRQGLFVTDVAPAGKGVPAGAGDAGAKPARSGRRRKLGKGKKLRNLAMFTRQLSVLVTSGTPLVDALGALERQATEPAWKDVVGSVRARVEEGATLADAMGEHPDVFDAICRSLIAAGESGGSFDKMLDRLALMTRKQLHVRSAVIGAMIYPCLLVVIAVNVLATMLLFVLPRFTGLFQTLNVALPPTTKMLVTASELLRAYWWAVPVVLVGGFFGGKFWLATPSGRKAFDAVALKLPMTGHIVRSFSTARIMRVLGVLLNGKVPLLDALGLTRQTVGNCYFVALVGRAEEAVTRGSTISSVFAESNLVSPSLVEAVRSGEQSGQLGPLLLNLSDFLDEENEVVIKSLTSILEPMIMIVLGVLVGFVAISMFLPLFDLTSMAQQQ